MDDYISRQDAIDALCHVDEYNGRSIEAIRQLPSAIPYTIHSDGRLWVTVDDIDKVNAVVVDESKSKFCKQFYMDAQPEIIYCKDCKHFVRDDIEEYTVYGFYNTYFHAFCDKHWDKEQGEYIDIKLDDYCSFAERRQHE